MTTVKVIKHIMMMQEIEVDDDLAKKLEGDCDDEEYTKACDVAAELANEQNDWEEDDTEYEFEVN